jgi:hypothetical protein
MKRFISILLAVALYAVTASAQAPQSLKYQTVVRNANGEIIANQPVNITLSILQGSTTGTSVCTELFQPTTNEFGLVNLEIGSQDPFSFSAINWANGPFFIRVSLDGNVMGTSQLLSVPYALYAEQSGNAGGNELWSENGSKIYYNGGNVGIGTMNPEAKLDIRGNSPDDGVSFRIGNSNSTHWLNFFGGRLNDPNPYIWWKAGDPLRFATDQGGWSEKMRITSDGKVGIMTSDPAYLLSISDQIGVEISSSPNSGVIRFGDNTGWKMHIGRKKESPGSGLNHDAEGALMTIVDNGNVGIGTTNPSVKLHIKDESSMWGNPRILVENTQIYDQVVLGFRSSGIYDWEFACMNDGNFVITDVQSGYTKLIIHPGASGAVAVPVLQITGGSDLAEPFPIAETLEEGTVVIIDENDPGNLIKSNQPYDKKVAGIVSGAGGIEPGLTLKQEGVMEGTQNIALSGRVYVKATAENGAIKPGDRLTTSSIPGHAMKATDDVLCPGSVIGKAMSSLEEGEGLVLVLVNLQ